MSCFPSLTYTFMRVFIPQFLFSGIWAKIVFRIPNSIFSCCAYLLSLDGLQTWKITLMLTACVTTWARHHIGNITWRDCVFHVNERIVGDSSFLFILFFLHWKPLKVLHIHSNTCIHKFLPFGSLCVLSLHPFFAFYYTSNRCSEGQKSSFSVFSFSYSILYKHFRTIDFLLLSSP